MCLKVEEHIEVKACRDWIVSFERSSVNGRRIWASKRVQCRYRGTIGATGMMIADSKSLMHINRVVVLICERGKRSVKASTRIGQSSSALLNLPQPFVRYLIVCASPEIGSNFRIHVTWRKLHNANNHYYSHSSVSAYVIRRFPGDDSTTVFCGAISRWGSPRMRTPNDSFRGRRPDALKLHYLVPFPID